MACSICGDPRPFGQHDCALNLEKQSLAMARILDSLTHTVPAPHVHDRACEGRPHCRDCGEPLPVTDGAYMWCRACRHRRRA